jgi:hypothetical protein
MNKVVLSIIIFIATICVDLYLVSEFTTTVAHMTKDINSQMLAGIVISIVFLTGLIAVIGYLLISKKNK